MGNMNKFELFCEYYLGLTPEGGYKFSNANKIARRLNCTVAEVMGNLSRHGMHPDVVLNTDFPLAKYSVELQLAADEESPEQLRARAKKIFQAFQSRAGKKRDWIKEIREEQSYGEDPS